MGAEPTTVDAYLAALPPERREALEAVRRVILDNLDDGYVEQMQYGMIGYAVPHSIYPDGYHCDASQPLPFASLASQKNHMAIYLMCVYSDPKLEAWLREAWAKSGKKKPDMGKSCIRFKRIEDVPLDVIGEAIRRVPVKKFVAHYESAIKPGPKKTTRKKAASKKKTSKKAAKKVATRKKTGRKR